MECVAFSCLLLRFGEDLGLIFEKMWYNGNYWRLIVMQLVRWGWRVLFAVVSGLIFPGSSMVEQEAVNFEVAGSSPAPGANFLGVKKTVSIPFSREKSTFLLVVLRFEKIVLSSLFFSLLLELL